MIVHLDACRGIAPETVASAHTQMIEAGAELAQTLIDVQRLLTPDMPPILTRQPDTGACTLPMQQERVIALTSLRGA